MTFDLTTILAALFGSGFLVAVIKLIVERRKRTAENDKTDAQTEGIHLSNEAHRIHAIGEQNKTIQDLAHESQELLAQMRAQNSQLLAAQADNEFLSTSLKNAKAIIDYQKTERHEWTEQLKNVLGELTDARNEITQLKLRVTELEDANKHDDDPLQVELVKGKK